MADGMKPSELYDRLDALIARAVDPGATEEEQRTSAVIACQTMRDYDMTGRTRKLQALTEQWLQWLRDNRRVLNRHGCRLPADL